nr:hypothetical protein [Sulfitobacter faviae]
MVLHPDFTVTTMWDPDPAACAAAQEVAPEAVVSATASEAMADVDLVYLACPRCRAKPMRLRPRQRARRSFSKNRLVWTLQRAVPWWPSCRPQAFRRRSTLPKRRGRR